MITHLCISVPLRSHHFHATPSRAIAMAAMVPLFVSTGHDGTPLKPDDVWMQPLYSSRRHLGQVNWGDL